MVGILNNSSESSSKSNSSSFYNHPRVNKNLLGSYLAGLIEGDGSIIVPKTIPPSLKRRGTSKNLYIEVVKQK